MGFSKKVGVKSLGVDYDKQHLEKFYIDFGRQLIFADKFLELTLNTNSRAKEIKTLLEAINSVLIKSVKTNNDSHGSQQTKTSPIVTEILDTFSKDTNLISQVETTLQAYQIVFDFVYKEFDKYLVKAGKKDQENDILEKVHGGDFTPLENIITEAKAA